MPNRLASKTALITGASSGLGRAIALSYAQEGARVACVDLFPTLRDEKDPATGKAKLVTERLAASSAAVPTHELLRQAHPGSDAIFVQADLTVAADVERAVAQCVEVFGRLDIMVNNAGISVESSHPRVLRCHETPEADYDKTMAINTKGVFLGCKYALAQMLDQEPLEGQNGDKGWIVNTASIQGLLAYHGTRESPSSCGVFPSRLMRGASRCVEGKDGECADRADSRLLRVERRRRATDQADRAGLREGQDPLQLHLPRL